MTRFLSFFWIICESVFALLYLVSVAHSTFISVAWVMVVGSNVAGGGGACRIMGTVVFDEGALGFCDCVCCVCAGAFVGSSFG